jgi:hypothetical protein
MLVEATEVSGGRGKACRQWRTQGCKNEGVKLKKKKIEGVKF